MTSQDPIKFVSQRFDRLESHFTSKIFPYFEDKHPTQVANWQRQLTSIKEELTKRPQTRIALLGSTGAGKSTLINALLGESILPTSSTGVCTATVTSVQHTEEKIYRAKITFLKIADWEKELDDLKKLTDKTIEEDSPNEVGDDDFTKVLKERMKAVYGLSELPKDITSLKLPEDILDYMENGKPLVIQEIDVKEFRKQLKDHLIPKKDHLIPKEEDKRHYWPLIKGVEVFGNFDTLRNGAIIVDLPGLNDPNQARQKVAEDYIKEASFIWVVCEIKRSMTADIENSLIEQRLLTRLLLEGRVDSLTFIGTSADNIGDESQAIEDFNLSEDATTIEIIRARNRSFIETTNSSMAKIASEMSEVIQKASDGENSLPKLRETLLQTKKLPVSSIGYFKPKKYGFNDENDTGIPDLISHLNDICTRNSPQTYANNLNLEIDLLKEELQLFFRAQLEEEVAEQFDRLREILNQLYSDLQEHLNSIKVEAINSFIEHQRVFESALQQAEKKAKNQLTPISEGWRSMNVKTLKACVDRDGESFTSSSKKVFYLNDDIKNCLFDPLMGSWNDFFDRNKTAFIQLGEQLAEHSESFMTEFNFKDKMTTSGSNATLAIISDSTNLIRNRLQVRVGDEEKRIDGKTKGVRRNLVTSIPTIIKEKMLVAYGKASRERGDGMRDRMVDILKEHAESSSSKIFNSLESQEKGEISSKLEGEISELTTYFIEQSKILVRDVYNQIKFILDNIEDNSDISDEDIAAITEIMQSTETL